MRQKLKHKYLMFSLAPILIVFLCAGALTVFLYHQTVSVMNAEAEKSSLRAVQSAAARMETSIRQARLSATGLALQSASARTDLSFYRTSIDKLMIVQLNTASMMNPLVQYGYLFYFDDDRALTQLGGASDASALFKSNLRLGGVDYAAFKAHFTSHYFSGECLSGFLPLSPEPSAFQWIIAQSVPADANATPTGVLIYTLDATAIQSALSLALTDDASSCALMDGTRAAFWTQGSENAWSETDRAFLESAASGFVPGANRLILPDGREMLACVARMDEYLVVGCVPSGTAFSGVRSFTAVTLVQAAAFVLLAAFTLALYTRRNAQSVQALLESIAPQYRSGRAADDDARNLFDYMKSVVCSMRQDNLTLSSHADRQKALLQSVFLRRLLSGEYEMESEVIAEETAVGVSLSAPYYRVLIVRFPEDDDTGAAHAFTRKSLADEFGENAYSTNMKNNRIACLILSAESDIDESLEAVMQAIRAKTPARGYASNEVTGIMDAPRAYREAKLMADRLCVEDAPLYRYGQWYQDAILYDCDYSQFAENKLLCLINAGRFAEVNEAFDQLWQESGNGDSRARNAAFYACDLYRLAGRASSALGNGKAGDALRELRAMMDDVIREDAALESYFARVREFCLSLCRKYGGARADAGRQTVDKINAYIEGHFTDPGMYVSSIAAAFDLTDKYLSQFYKEQTGEKISNVIENKRVGRACALMDDAGLTIGEVATQAGYANAHTFRAAFKKVYGVTPTQYREGVR